MLKTPGGKMPGGIAVVHDMMAIRSFRIEIGKTGFRCR